MRSEPTRRPHADRPAVEPSRAWILGLVPDADGMVSDTPVTAPEWPASPATNERSDQIPPPDGPTVRP